VAPRLTAPKLNRHGGRTLQPAAVPWIQAVLLRLISDFWCALFTHSSKFPAPREPSFWRIYSASEADADGNRLCHMVRATYLPFRRDVHGRNFFVYL
jgi:hypothetical protein